MKYKKKLFLIGIAAVLVFEIGFWFLVIRPISSDTIAEGMKKLQKKVDRLKSCSNQSSPISTAERNKAFKANRDALNEERAKILSMYRKRDEAGLDKWFDNVKNPGTVEFTTRYQKEMGDLYDRLVSKDLLLDKDGKPGNPLQDDSRQIKNEKTMAMAMKLYNVQKALVDVFDDGEVEKVAYLRLGKKARAWDKNLHGVMEFDEKYADKKGQYRASGEIVQGVTGPRSIDFYYSIIPVSFDLRIKFEDIPRLLEKIDKSPVLFRFRGMKMEKVEVTRIGKIPKGKKWMVKRKGETRETKALAEGYVDDWRDDNSIPRAYPRIIPSTKSQKEGVRTLNFDSYLSIDAEDVVMPESHEILDEHYVRLVLLYEVIDFIDTQAE